MLVAAPALAQWCGHQGGDMSLSQPAMCPARWGHPLKDGNIRLVISLLLPMGSPVCHGGEHHHSAPYKGIVSGPVFTSHPQDKACLMYSLQITPLECCLAPLSNSQMRTRPLSDMTRVTKAAGGRAELDLHLQVLMRCQTIFQACSKASHYLC